MAVSFGFYNSLNGDRKYNTRQISEIFDGLISDGVYKSIGTAFIVKAKEANTVNVGIGRSWFNHTWTYNDALLPITLEDSDLVLDRIDAIVIEVDSSDSVRSNSIKFITGTPSSEPQKPVMEHTVTKNQYPLCYITRKKGSSSITDDMIENRVGTEECPFVTGIIESVTTDDLLAQWEAQYETWFTSAQQKFDTWFQNLETQLEGDIAANLQLQIDKINSERRITLTTSWTNENDKGYTQLVSLAGVKESDGPYLDVLPADTTSENEEITEEWSKYFKAETLTDQIKFYFYEPTEKELTVIVKGV